MADDPALDNLKTAALTLLAAIKEKEALYGECDELLEAMIFGALVDARLAALVEVKEAIGA